jgi:hypothetical protein
MKRLSFVCFLFVCGSLFLNSPAQAQVLIDEDFESYATDGDFLSAWPSNSTDPDEFGIIVPCLTQICPPSPFDGLGDASTLPATPASDGQSIAFNDLSYYHERTSDDSGTALSLLPTASQSIKLSGDIFDNINGNRRFGLGLRSSAGANLLELGNWNADTFDPTDPINAPPNSPVTDQPTTGYGYRIILWDEVGGSLVREPNWQYFPLDPAFDDVAVDHNSDGRLGNGDGLVTAVDVGPGWHTYSAVITDTDVTLELDLFRDGTIDSTVTWEITAQQAFPFDSLRLGGPSGVAMNEFTMADNISLELMGGSAVDGDFDGNGLYECADVDGLVNAIVVVKGGGAADLSFDLNQDGFVDDSDLVAWRAEAGAVLTASGNPIQEGDADLDGNVNGSDFVAWNGAKFTSVSSWCNGDFNADGDVNGVDFVIWNTNKFTSADVVGVPEPSAMWLLFAGALLMRRRRSL